MMQLRNFSLTPTRRPVLFAFYLHPATVFADAVSFDLIPDFVLASGCFDDAVIVPALVYATLQLISPELVTETSSKCFSRSRLRGDRHPHV